MDGRAGQTWTGAGEEDQTERLLSSLLKKWVFCEVGGKPFRVYAAGYHDPLCFSIILGAVKRADERQMRVKVEKGGGGALQGPKQEMVCPGLAQQGH